MATLNQILHEIKEGDNSFHITDDYRVDDMLIIEMINDVRATLIRDEKTRTGFIAGNYYQTDCCYEIVCEEDSCTFNGVEISTGKKMYKVKLRPLIESLGGLELKYIGNPSLGVEFQPMSFDQFLASVGRLFTAGEPAATLMGSDLWLKNLPTPGMKFVCLTALLKNPTTACDWDNDKTEYPVPSKSKLIDMVNYRLMSKGRMPADKLNNAADDLVPPKTTDQAVAAMQQLAIDPERERAMQQQAQQKQ
jgi:hypothetical protein